MTGSPPDRSALVDETLRQRYEASWTTGSPLPLADCLPGVESDGFLPTLEELVHIRLDFAWKTHASGTGPRPESVESLLDEFPSLRNPDVMTRLLRQESDCRKQAGDTVGATDDTAASPPLAPDDQPVATPTPTDSADIPAETLPDQATIPPATPTPADTVPDQATIPPDSADMPPDTVPDQATIPPPTTERNLPDDQEQPADAPVVDDPTIYDAIPSATSSTPIPNIQIEGYEILGILGRGGMGVVYRALDTRLKRVVALKMILSGVHAGPEELERFHREAEAVAQLQHPNIVQIHDVGEHDGQSYFSLEFVEGGELASRIAGEPQPPDEAAQLVETLSRAMQFAHERNIIHRDLKPANVLLTSDGEPKITDFGLAKRLEDEAGQTASGSIMGTPSFMAPEQAGGHQAQIGPQTDIYALGALLYCMLTGRPPFQSANVMDTVLQVLEQDPVPPHQLVKGLDKNLETITLKCLQKDPARRYQAADEVADELQRYLRHEPILARPVGAIERTWRWCRRKPAIASLIVGLVVSLVAGTVISSVFAVSERQQRKIAQSNQQRAQQRFEQAVEVVDRLVQVCEHLAFYPGVQDDRSELLKLAGDYYQQLSDDESGGRNLQVNSARTLLKLAGVFEQLGDSKKSLEVFRNSESRLLVLQQVGRNQGDLSDVLADCRIRIAGVLARSDDTDQARILLESVLESFGDRPGEAIDSELAARASYGLAEIAIGQGALDQAADRLGTAAIHYRRLAEQPDVSVNLVFGLATSLSRHGEVLSDLEKFDQAVLRLKEAESLLRDRVVTSDDVDPRHAKQLAVTRSQLAGVLRQLDREAESIQAMEATIISLEALVRLVPDMVEFHEDHARALVNMGHLSHQLENATTAEAYVEKGREILVRLHDSVDSDKYIKDIATAQLMLGLVKLDLESDNLALVNDLLDGAVNLFEQLGPDAPAAQQRTLATNLSEAFLAQSVLQERLGHVAEAVSLADQAREFLDHLVENERGTTQLDALARCHVHRARLQELNKASAEARASIELALKLRKELAERGRYRRAFALLLARSESTRTRAIEVARQLTVDQPASFRGWLTLATVQIKSELWSQAHETLQEAEKRTAGIPSARLHLLKTISLRQLGKTDQAASSLATGRELLLQHAPARADLLELAAQAGKLMSEGR